MTPILVRNIKHLTDARYFAAMGVDWMSLELTADSASFMLWHTIRSWVEGVELAAEIDVKDEMLLAKTIIDAQPNGIILKDAANIELPPGLTLFYETNATGEETAKPEGNTILLYNDMTPIEVVLEIPADKLFLQAKWSAKMLDDLLAKGYTGGICFIGGDEDMTGVRDYGAMDEMLAVLGR